MPPTPRPAILRLLARIDKSNDCWIWPGATNGRGYGVIGGDTRPVRNTYVHRVMWEHHNGPIPAGMEIAHTCDVRNCVRPEHLFLATHAENVADQVRKGRQRRGQALYWSAILTETDVLAMRRRHAAGESASSLAREFGVSSSAAEYAIRGLRWKHI